MEKINILFGTGKQGIAKFAPLIVLVIALLSMFMSPIFATILTTSDNAYVLFTILLILIGMSVPLVRYFENRASKMVGYVLLGIATFWIVGGAYSELGSFGQFLPVLIFALAVGIAIEIALLDGVIYSYMFSAFGFSAVAFNVLFYRGLEYVGDKPDMLLLIAVLWALVPMLWCYFLSKAVKNLRFNAKKVIAATVMSAISTIPVYILLGASVLLSQPSNAGFGIPSMARIGELADSSDLIINLLGASWYYVLAHMVVIVGVFFINSAVLHAFNIDKEFNEDGDIIYTKITKVDMASLEDVDPYRQIVKEMKDYSKEFSKGKVNRISATQNLGKFRSKMDILTSKYERGSMNEAVELLKHLEHEAEFMFR